MFTTTKSFFVLILITLLIASCGGGGSDAPPVDTPTPPPPPVIVDDDEGDSDDQEDVSDDEGEGAQSDNFVLDGNADLDDDSIPNTEDNCPAISNVDQIDSDNNGIGDACQAEETTDATPESAPDLTADNTPNILINGYNASVAIYESDFGGAYVQLSDGIWVQNRIDISRQFTEVSRDEWSVYLKQVDANQYVQLDYYRNKIRLRVGLSSYFDAYDIVSSDPSIVNGFSATRVVYEAPEKVFGVGGFVQINRETWSETNADDTFIFTIVERTESSIFLRDADRGVDIELDLNRNKVVFGDDFGTSFDLYDIRTAAPEQINAFVVREYKNDFTTFLQTGAFSWVETLSDGTQYTYEEYSRDEWSSFLRDESRNVKIQIDLFLDVIKYELTAGSGFIEYKGVIGEGQPDLVTLAGPIAWYTFDNGTAADASGRSNHLTWDGGVFADRKGARDEALLLDGNNSAAILPEGIVNYLDDFTISTFVKIEKLEESSRVFDFGSDANNYMYLTPVTEDNKVVQFAINDRSGEQTISGTVPLTGGVNGFNAKVVMHSSNGAFVQLSGRNWVENGATASGSFMEVNRDEWSVYLRDDSRGVNIQLDLYRNKVVYSDDNGGRFDLYDISSVSPDEINGYAASRIRHRNGGFFHLSPGRWVEDAGENSFFFEEVLRDEWSVYLYDPYRRVSIQLNLLNKEIFYRDSVQEFVLYDISDTRPIESEPGWVHVAVTKEGTLGKLYINGAEVGRNENLTISPANLGETTNNYLGRSQFSNDPDFKGSIDDFRIYNYALSQREIKKHAAPDPGLITVMGTDIQFSPEEFVEKIESEGFEFVTPQSDNSEVVLEPGQCTLIYANADKDDISAEAGLLTCSVLLANGDIELNSKVVYGGCDVARPGIENDVGGGFSCVAGTASKELRIKVGNNPAVYNNVDVNGPNSHACSALSTENTCLSVGADIASASYGWESENGTGLGMGVAVGVGAGFSSGISDGVLSGSIDLKLGLGISLQYSISGDDVLEVAKLGETAWLESSGAIIAVGDKTIGAFEDFGNEVHDVGGKAVSTIEVAGKEVIVFTENAGKSVEETFLQIGGSIEGAAKDVENGIIDTAGVVAKGIDAATNETVTFVGDTVEDIEECVSDFFGCIF